MCAPRGTAAGGWARSSASAGGSATPSSSHTAIGDAAHEVLYRVGFACGALWPDYDGGEHDRVEIEIYEHWLEPVPGDAT